jgi:hypothetical protein
MPAMPSPEKHADINQHELIDTAHRANREMSRRCSLNW